MRAHLDHSGEILKAALAAELREGMFDRAGRLRDLVSLAVGKVEAGDLGAVHEREDTLPRLAGHIRPRHRVRLERIERLAAATCLP